MAETYPRLRQLVRMYCSETWLVASLPAEDRAVCRAVGRDLQALFDDVDELKGMLAEHEEALARITDDYAARIADLMAENDELRAKLFVLERKETR